MSLSPFVKMERRRAAKMGSELRGEVGEGAAGGGALSKKIQQVRRRGPLSRGRDPSPRKQEANLPLFSRSYGRFTQ